MRRRSSPLRALRPVARAGSVTLVALVARVALGAGLAGSAACSSTDLTGGGALSACDPLAPPPTTLTNVLGVGRDAEGTLYVADLPAGASTPRVFVSSGAELRRAHVAGAGSEGAGGGASYALELEILGRDASDARSLIVQMQGATAGAMSLSADPKSFGGGTPLTLVDASTVARLPIVNLPGVARYVADVADGTVIVVTSPMDGDASADFRLYYGPPAEVTERAITSFVQALSGYPTIAFTVGAATYTMAIGGVFTGAPGPGVLSTPGGTLPFTIRWPTPATLGGMSFQCSTVARSS